MTDENNQRRQEQQEEAALGLLMKEYAQIEGEALWQKFQAAEAARNEPESQTREYRETSRRREGADRRIKFLKSAGIGCRRAAVIFLVLICLLSPLAMSVEAFKLPVINYFVALEQKFSRFDFGENAGLGEEQEAIVDLILAVPCPAGYHIAEQGTTQDGTIWLDFEDEEENVMRISLLPSKGQINIDTEDVQQIPMKVQDYEAVYLKKNGHRLMWMDAERELIFNIRVPELEEEDFWRYVHKLAIKLSQ